MKRALYTSDGRFVACHSFALPEPEPGTYAWVTVTDDDAKTLSTLHCLVDGVWTLLPPTVTLPDAQKAARSRRDSLLLASDWTQLPDVPAATRLAWQSYRQALRDITTQPDPTNIVWPTSPE